MKLLLLLFPALLAAQPANLHFTEGTPGKVPTGWTSSTSQWGYSAELRDAGCKSVKCAVVLSPAAPPPNTFGNMMQSFDAAPYRGKYIRLRAWVKAEPTVIGDKAQMWFRVDRPNRQIGLFDNMANRPITTAEWKLVEITGAISLDAEKINLGVMEIGKGKAWVDNMEFDVLRDATAKELAAATHMGEMNSAQSPPPAGRFARFQFLILPGIVLVLLLIPVTRVALAHIFAPQNEPWSWPATLAYRWIFCFLVLHVVGTDAWHQLTPWVAIHWFHLSGDAVTYKLSGSGDKALDYVLVFCLLLISAALVLVWTLLDRRSRNYRLLNSWTRLVVRYSVAAVMLGYGFAKVYPTQMPPPNVRRLLEPYGDLSPMGVAWAFIGSSMAYEIFSGAMEALGGALLLFRRTALLGGLLSVAVMANVVMLNLCYDVPVKLFSIQILLTALFVVAPDIPRLAGFFFSRQPTPATSSDPPPLTARWTHYVAYTLKSIIILVMLYTNVIEGHQGYKTRYGQLERPPLYGVYSVETFMRGGKSDAQWKQVVCEHNTSVEVRSAIGGDAVSYSAVYDEPHHILTLNGKDVLTYTRMDDGRVELKGTLEGDPVEIHMQNSRLLRTGFHWVQEFPVNR